MTPDSLRALLDAAAKAVPGPARDSQCGLEECAGKLECALCVAQRTYDPAKALAAAASPDVVAALARIALAAVEVSLLKTAISHAATQGSGAFIDAYIKLGLAENAMNDALRDAGLLTTAPQEPK